LMSLLSQLGGATLLGVGIWVVVDGESFFKIFGAISTSVLQVVNVSYFLIVIGAILLIIGFLGCCGAQKESKCLLMTFFTVVLIIFIAEVAAAVVALVYTGLAETLLTATVTPLLKEKFGKEPSLTQIWNVTMNELHCCGLNNYTDLTESPWIEKYHSYPAPCCSGKQPCNESLADRSDVPPRSSSLFPCFLQGCFDQLLTEIRKNSGVVGGVAAGIAALEIASMVVSMYLYCRLDEK
ncbi:TSN1 protein, partial [Nothoprocta ornata]|nr:TSN1 protein [Nothoprocta ornata]